MKGVRAYTLGVGVPLLLLFLLIAPTAFADATGGEAGPNPGSFSRVRPRLLVMSDLPLFRGEGTIADVMAGRVRRAALLDVLAGHYALVPVDELASGALPPPSPGHADAPLLLLAQPRRFSPVELVTLDDWIRSGGRALIFTDPWLVWPSRYPQGDPRRPPPVGLLDPLLDHWGLVLGDSDGARREQIWDGVSIVTLASGDLAIRASGAAAGCANHIDAREGTGGEPNRAIADCRLGRGRVMVVGDADLLDERVWQGAAPRTPQWVLDRLDDLAGFNRRPAGSESGPGFTIPTWVMMALATAGMLVGGGILIFRFRRRRKETGG